MSRNVRKSRDHLIAELTDVVRAQQRAVDRFDQAVVDLFGLNRTDGRIVDLLQEYGPMSAGEVSTAAHLSTGAVTTAVDRLVERGLVRRTRDPDDRRRVIIEITDKTNRAVAEIFGTLAEEGHMMLETFTNGEIDAITRYLQLDLELHERHADALVARARLAKPRKRGSGARGR